MSKLVERGEVGKVYSVVGVGQAIIAFVSHRYIIYCLVIKHRKYVFIR